MWIFWIILFISSSLAFFLFIKKQKKALMISVVEETPEKSSALAKNFITQLIHSPAWLMIVNETEKILRRIRILFLKIDNLVLDILNKVRGHSSKIAGTNLGEQTNDVSESAPAEKITKD